MSRREAKPGIDHAGKRIDRALGAQAQAKRTREAKLGHHFAVDATAAGDLTPQELADAVHSIHQHVLALSPETAETALRLALVRTCRIIIANQLPALQRDSLLPPYPLLLYRIVALLRHPQQTVACEASLCLKNACYSTAEPRNWLCSASPDFLSTFAAYLGDPAAPLDICDTLLLTVSSCFADSPTLRFALFSQAPNMYHVFLEHCRRRHSGSAENMAMFAYYATREPAVRGDSSTRLKLAVPFDACAATLPLAVALLPAAASAAVAGDETLEYVLRTIHECAKRGDAGARLVHGMGCWPLIFNVLAGASKGGTNALIIACILEEQAYNGLLDGLEDYKGVAERLVPHLKSPDKQVRACVWNLFAHFANNAEPEIVQHMAQANLGLAAAQHMLLAFSGSITEESITLTHCCALLHGIARNRIALHQLCVKAMGSVLLDASASHDRQQLALDGLIQMRATGTAYTVVDVLNAAFPDFKDALDQLAYDTSHVGISAMELLKSFDAEGADMDTCV